MDEVAVRIDRMRLIAWRLCSLKVVCQASLTTEASSSVSQLMSMRR